jgi:hypothetical protein
MNYCTALGGIAASGVRPISFIESSAVVVLVIED